MRLGIVYKNGKKITYIQKYPWNKRPKEWARENGYKFDHTTATIHGGFVDHFK